MFSDAVIHLISYKNDRRLEIREEKHHISEIQELNGLYLDIFYNN